MVKPMKAFAEELKGRAWIIRSGPDATEFKKPYDFSGVLVEETPGVGTFKALVNPWPKWMFWKRRFSRAHFDAGVKVIKGLGLKPKWERFK